MKKIRVLIMGLSGSGKTTLARKLNVALSGSELFNADIERHRAEDWDFSDEGRIRQARRMRDLADASSASIVIADFIAGICEQRDIFRPHVLVWMNTVTKSKYADTDARFGEPCICTIRFDSFEEVDTDKVLDAISTVANKGDPHDPIERCNHSCAIPSNN